MFLSTNNFSSSMSQNLITINLHYSRRMLLQTRFYHTPAAPPPNYQLYPLSHPNNRKFDSNVIMILSILLCALIFSLCVNSLFRCIVKCSNVINQGLNNNNTVSINQPKGTCGMDNRGLRTFPVIKYSKEGMIKGLDTECVICLSEFEEEELVRILPKCRHGFHVMCIDKWLSSHTSCPTCRQSLVESCKKVNKYQETSSVRNEGETNRISPGGLPLEREDIFRSYRG